MRVMREYQVGAVNIHADQYSSLAARAEEAWNEWEIQFLVMASLLLQVFLMVSAPFRKRHKSSVLSFSLWIAYLMADYVATYLLGRLTLLVAVAKDGTRQQLALFWAPFLLLHLGGQETITALSMEDNTLWKRRLLDLGSQVAMAVYLVGKQWRRGDNRLLVAPLVLMFIVGATKYGERIWALRAATVRSSSISIRQESVLVLIRYYKCLFSMSSSKGKMSIERILEVASIDFSRTLDFFLDVIPLEQTEFDGNDDVVKSALIKLKSSKNRDGVAYKLAEVQLSLIHDYLYTKFGTVRFQAPKSSINPITGGALQWLGSLGLTSVALVLFAWASSRSNRHYSGADVLISYILLVGAIVMEVSSIFIALVSSCWAGSPGTGLAKLLHLHIGEMWSGKLPQYNMVDDCVQKKERQAAAGGVVGTALRWMLQAASCQTTTPHVVVSPEVKKLLLDKVLEIATDQRNQYWDFSRFQGQWAVWVASRVDGNDDHRAGPAHEALTISRVQKAAFVRSVVLWYSVTSICLLAGDDAPSELTNPCKDLSNYIMYLVAKCRVMVDSYGQIFIDSVSELGSEINRLCKPEIMQILREGNLGSTISYEYYEGTYAVTYTACHVCVELFKIPEARARWELIDAVWTEILCYMALNCGAAFHAKHLTTGGEFLTQVKMLLFITRLPFLKSRVNEILYP